MRLTTVVICAVGALLWAAGCDAEAPELDDGGDGASAYDNVNGYCLVQPSSCDDLIQEGDATPSSCCFSNQLYTCINGALKYKDCSAGCYNSADGTPHCYSTNNSSDDPGEWQDPPTDPGPGF